MDYPVPIFSGKIKSESVGWIALFVVTNVAITSRTSPQPEIADEEPVMVDARIRALEAELAAARIRIAELEVRAERDDLLDIFNRRGFLRELHRALAYRGRYGGGIAVLLFDVDLLKPVNDTFGHAAGDAVLRAVVETVQRHVRASDVVGRLGGDEFAVLLWNVADAGPAGKAAMLEQAVDELRLVFDGQEIGVGISVGAAVAEPGDDAAMVLERADRAMYARKAQRGAGRSVPVRSQHPPFRR